MLSLQGFLAQTRVFNTVVAAHTSFLVTNTESYRAMCSAQRFTIPLYAQHER